VAPILPAVYRNATHAAQYGDIRVFTFDERAYLERDGFWTRANALTVVVLQRPGEFPRSSGLSIAVTAGAVATTVHLAAGNWAQTLSLAPGVRQPVELPPATGNSWVLRIRSGAGFRPSEREPGSIDVRKLAAWITIQ
jgi:hypothetical protein